MLLHPSIMYQTLTDTLHSSVTAGYHADKLVLVFIRETLLYCNQCYNDPISSKHCFLRALITIQRLLSPFIEIPVL